VHWETLLLGLAVFLSAGSASGHLVPGWEVHLDLYVDAEYSPGKPVRLMVDLSNPSVNLYHYQWGDGCYLDFGIFGEGRSYYDTRLAAHPCTLAVVDIEVPAGSLFSLFHGELDPSLWQGFEGCVTVEVYLAGTVLQGLGETCPRDEPLPPFPASTLGIIMPGLVRSGETFPVEAIVRSTEGAPLEGAEVLWTLPGLTSGQVFTGADGGVVFNGTAPIVTEPTLLILQLEVLKEGWSPTLTSRHLSVFPAEGLALVLRVRAVTGDLVEVGGIAEVEVFVEDDRGLGVDGPETAFEISGPLVIMERTRLSPNSELLRLSAGPVNGTGSLRIVANAPGFGGTETTVDFLVLSQRESGDAPLPGAAQGPERWLVVVALVIPPIAVFAFLLWRSRRKEPNAGDDSLPKPP